MQTTPAQHQEQRPGKQHEMRPQPQTDRPELQGADRLRDKVVLVTGGDSGIGRAVAVAAAKEGGKIVFAYLNEEDDARETERLVGAYEAPCISLRGDVGDEEFCRAFVEQAFSEFGAIDVLVNNAGEQSPQESIEDITAEQLERTFRTNIFSQFYLVREAVRYMKPGSAIVNIASVSAYEGNPRLIDYSSTKGAIVSFGRALSNSLIERGIRVNTVAPGPIWTPLIPSTFPEDRVASFGQDVPMKRPGQPAEVASAVIFLASEEASYISGQTLHVNGGQVVNS
jgi:NAD(P)-dependent dehydrogenase (short-subunit alcohol dehydrogenase family)